MGEHPTHTVQDNAKTCSWLLEVKTIKKFFFIKRYYKVSYKEKEQESFSKSIEERSSLWLLNLEYLHFICKS